MVVVLVAAVCCLDAMVSLSSTHHPNIIIMQQPLPWIKHIGCERPIFTDKRSFLALSTVSVGYLVLIVFKKCKLPIDC